MKSVIYESPLRVYLVLGILAFVGIFCGLTLPISLFPSAAKSVIGVDISYGSLTMEEFKNLHGRELESQLRSLSGAQVEVKKVQVHYRFHQAHFSVETEWGTSARVAIKEVENTVHAYSSRLSEESRDHLWIYPEDNNTGFVAISFFSPTRTLDDLYRLLEPKLIPKIVQIPDAFEPELWNPSEKEVRIELNQNRMAAFQIFPSDVESAVRKALSSAYGGPVTVGLQQLVVQIPRSVSEINDLNHVLIPTPYERSVFLGDVAQVDYGLKTIYNRTFNTSGAPSLILWAIPRPDGNMKKMSERILDIVHQESLSFPQDVKYQVVVDPSEFIRAAVENVTHEVLLGALLAVCVLYCFIGSIKNIATAAIEIPLSMVLALIPMKLSGMSINLISLGGLALSAGMNVDASVVVMENIFRHFEHVEGPLDFKKRLSLVLSAVREVRFPVIASTLTSLVVFLPLTLTSGLNNAILSDLAKAVVFSHGFSAIVALVLVPTVRLQLMSLSDEKHIHSPFEKSIKRLEAAYGRLLERFIISRSFQRNLLSGIVLVLGFLIIFVLPKLPKEAIGKPDTDWIALSIFAEGNTKHKQMESVSDELEFKLREVLGTSVRYTFSQVTHPNSGFLMARISDKKEIHSVLKKVEKEFTNTPFLKFKVELWNPAELPIPDPPDMKLVIRGGSREERVIAARDLYRLMEESQVFPRLWSDPSAERAEGVFLLPRRHLWSSLHASGVQATPNDLADWVRVLTSGRKISELMIDDKIRDVYLRFEEMTDLHPEKIASLPIGIDGKVVPLKALAQIKVKETIPTLFHENGREQFSVLGKLNLEDPPSLAAEKRRKAEGILKTYLETRQRASQDSPLSIEFEDAAIEIHDAMDQLMGILALSIGLIFLTLVVQFGSFVDAILVMVAIPLGLIGVLIALFVFNSTLSLNSILGVILLNGIAVANSIILVDFIHKRVNDGLAPREAAIDAAQKRLRPILITSLTTILGMMPIALGLGEGGHILQPLGISVGGGLWASMGFTLFIVPALQVAYLEKKTSSSIPSSPSPRGEKRFRKFLVRKK